MRTISSRFSYLLSEHLPYDETHISALIRVGTAGWSIPAEHTALFPADGTHLERYAQRLTAVEINSSFYRPHRASMYARWAASTPASFRFAVKMPREITHFRKLGDEVAEPLDRFLAECGALGPKLGPLLVQLPPSLVFDQPRVTTFFERLRARFEGSVACEPRHPTWFASEADQVLADFQIARVAADPAIVPTAALPGGWSGLVYYRLHGSPRIYNSDYSAEYLARLTVSLSAVAARSAETWCIFDNTAAGAATVDALKTKDRLARVSDKN